MYNTKLVWPGVYEEKATLQLATSSSTTYSATIDYSSEAVTAKGVTSLVNPESRTFTSLASFSALIGKYIELDGVVYLIPSGSAVSQSSSGDTYTVKAPAQKVTYAPMTLYSGADQQNAIQNCTITWTSNKAVDLTMGSVCAAMLECKIIAPDGGLTIDAGSRFQAFKVAEDGTETQIGVFNVETPTRLTAHTYKILAYDNVRKLDKDLTEWFNALDGWPYRVRTLAKMIAEQCGLTISSFDGPSYDDITVDNYHVYRFTVKEGTTGRQLMFWICEALCDYCIADADGSLKCTWYDGSLLKIGPTSEYDHYYFQGSLTNEDYDASEISGFEILEEAPASNQTEAGDSGNNDYLIVGNPVILNHPYYTGESMVVDPDTGELVWTPYGKWLLSLQVRYNFLETFTPFKVSIPEDPSLVVGRKVEVTDANGNTFKSCLMNLTWSGHKMTLECTGNRTRANSNAPSTLSNKQLMEYSDQVGKKATFAVESATHPGCYYRTVDGETEWINPPMELGVEYRTTKRYLGKPVYTKAVNFGALPNAASKNAAYITTGSATAVSLWATLSTGCVLSSGWGLDRSLSSTYRIHLDNTKMNVRILTEADFSATTAVVVIEYVYD